MQTTDDGSTSFNPEIKAMGDGAGGPGAQIERMSGDIRENIAAAAKAAEDYRFKVFEYMRDNLNTTLDYAHSLAQVKSPTELVELSAQAARKPQDEAHRSNEPDLLAAARAAEDYHAKVFEFMKLNVNATLDYAQRLASVKTPAEFVDLSTSHARRLFETIAAQTTELGILAQTLTARNTERMTAGFSDLFTKPDRR